MKVQKSYERSATLNKVQKNVTQIDTIYIIIKASSILGDRSVNILYISFFTHILTIVVKYGETHIIQQIYNVYIAYKKVIQNITHNE